MVAIDLFLAAARLPQDPQSGHARLASRDSRWIAFLVTKRPAPPAGLSAADPLHHLDQSGRFCFVEACPGVSEPIRHCSSPRPLSMRVEAISTRQRVEYNLPPTLVSIHQPKIFSSHLGQGDHFPVPHPQAAQLVTTLVRGTFFRGSVTRNCGKRRIDCSCAPASYAAFRQSSPPVRQLVSAFSSAKEDPPSRCCPSLCAFNARRNPVDVTLASRPVRKMHPQPLCVAG